MESSLVKLFNRMERENTTPIQWNQIKIRSIHKKDPKEDLANQRGIFLTNIVSEAYEKVKLLQNEENICNMFRMQCAERKIGPTGLRHHTECYYRGTKIRKETHLYLLCRR